MNRKIPQDAFGFYWSLGPERSYQAVAEHFQVSKRAVSKVAIREDWSGRIQVIEKKANERTDEKLAETIEQMTERHVKIFKLVQRKALEALKSMPLTTAFEAVKALDLAAKQERLARGEPTDRSQVDVEQIIKREYERWLIRADVKEESGFPTKEEESGNGEDIDHSEDL